MNEQELIRKRLMDLSRQANRKGIVLFSDFLNLNELNIYHQSEKLFETKTESFGGVPFAERQMIAFLPDALYYAWNYPITAFCIKPSYPKFAEKLGHRDILGSIMNLGVDRSKIGDIIPGNGVWYLLCAENVADYFKENLTKIRHTLVTLEECQPEEIRDTQTPDELPGIVPSNRLDSMIACVYKLSRSQSLELFRQEKVFVNGRITTSVTYACRPGDVISVRGFGRFVYESVQGETNKGRLKFHYRLYRN